MSIMVNVYNSEGEKVREMELPASVFGVEHRGSLLHDAVVAYESNRRQVLAHTKDRGDVSGGGKKPWKQKGTGRARHGSIRSPLWVGGGVTFGPRNNRNFEKKLNRKSAQKALKMVLSDRALHGGIGLIEGFTMEFKTKACVALSRKISPESAHRILLVTKEVNRDLVRCVANVSYIDVSVASDLNAYDTIRYAQIIMSEDAVPVLVDRLT